MVATVILISMLFVSLNAFPLAVDESPVMSAALDAPQHNSQVKLGQKNDLNILI